jgi:glycosyltransferase involved in cell wall biosynthesis
VADQARPQILVVHHTLNPPGGGSAVGAWTLEALRERYEPTVLTWGPVDLARVNRAFGTHLRASDARWERIGTAVRAAIDAVPLPLALLSSHVIFRRARALLARHRFAAVISTNNEIDVGVRAIQYIHYPWAKMPRPDVDYRWYHYAPPLRAYRAACARLSGYRKEQIPRNVTLVNSDWTGRVFARYYGAPARTLYPPVAGGFPDVPFAERDDAFACVGRLSGEKEIEKLIAIMARVHAQGHAIRFHVIGPADDQPYLERLHRLAAPHRDWLAFHHDLTRDELVRIVARCRYGIHGMVGEHFGIAPAELQRAGCITFVPHDGGPVEIVGGDERVVYRSADDAVAKIGRVLADDGLRAAVLADVERRKDRFTETRFMREMLEVVEAVAGDRA